MKKSDLKQLIKPLVKECIHEVLLEEGLLSNVVAEVAKGMQGNLITESRAPSPPPRAKNPEIANAKIAEQRKKLMGALNADAYNNVNLFEGTEPISSHEAADPSPGGVDLGNPRDAGVDISALTAGASKVWQSMK
tara:strand:+ start:59 stop:463 length:405 start_codon:yes stop_codon:yes gene_type:complete